MNWWFEFISRLDSWVFVDETEIQFQIKKSEEWEHEKELVVIISNIRNEMNAIEVELTLDYEFTNYQFSFFKWSIFLLVACEQKIFASNVGRFHFNADEVEKKLLISFGIKSKNQLASNLILLYFFLFSIVFLFSIEYHLKTFF